MSDPKRWLEPSGGATPHERGILQAGAAMDPPHGAQASVWAALSVHMGPLGGGGDPGGGLPDPTAPSTAAPAAGGAPAGAGTGASGGAAASGGAGATTGSLAAAGKVVGSTVGASVAKGVAIGMASVALLGGGYAAVRMASLTPAPAAVQSAKAVEQEPMRPPAVPGDSAGATPAASNAASSLEVPSSARDSAVRDEHQASTAPHRPSGTGALGSAPPVKTPSATREPDADAEPASSGALRASSLHEESQTLGEARSALRRGDTAGAQRKLEEMGERFPDGVLAQEREALAIEALHRSGQRAAASTRAAEFLRAHPTSPHATKIRGFIQ